MVVEIRTELPTLRSISPSPCVYVSVVGASAALLACLLHIPLPPSTSLCSHFPRASTLCPCRPAEKKSKAVKSPVVHVKTVAPEDIQEGSQETDGLEAMVYDEFESDNSDGEVSQSFRHVADSRIENSTFRVQNMHTTRGFIHVALRRVRADVSTPYSTKLR